MEIIGTRIRTLKKRVDQFGVGATIYIGTIIDPEMKPALISIGFEADLSVGSTVLPTGIGPRTIFNSEGSWEVRKDLPMETAYRQRDWEWEEWDGTRHSKIVDIPYKRYPRTRVLPPGVELQITNTADGQRVLVSPPVVYGGNDDITIIHIVNMFLEIVGRCTFFDDGLGQIISVPIRRLNWTLLPPGKRPWVELRPLVEEVVDNAPGGNQVVILDRFETINSFQPEMVAVGRAGFAGYVVFGFERSNLYVLESIYSGNATYLLGEDWDSLSQLTKSEVLDQELHICRLIHTEGWSRRLESEMAIHGISK